MALRTRTIIALTALTALMASIWRGIEATSRKPDLNLSQVLSCLAIVNGSPASTGSTDGVSCPTEYSQDLGPIRFNKRAHVPSTLPAVEILADVLKDPAAEGLVFRLVGHSDFKGDDNAKRKTSLYRAEELKKVLQSKGVPKERLRTQGRNDSEPFGQTQDQFSDGDKTGKCTLLGKAVNCDRRVSIEIASPLVARYGLLAEGRKRSSLISSDKNVPYVRHYPNGLIPGQPYSIDLRKLIPKDKDLGLKWHPDCQRVATDWIKVKATGSLFDKHAGPLWIRARSREDVDSVSGSRGSRSGSAQTLVLELAATESTPEHGKETPLPDYWAVRMRMNKMDDKKIDHALVPVFKCLRDRILGVKSPPDCDESPAIARGGSEKDESKTDPKQLERQRAARACLGSLLVENSNEIDIPLIAQIEGVIPDNLAMHGDDRLAQAFGVNAWAPSFSLQPGMELCISNAKYIRQSGNNSSLGLDDGSVDCSKLLRVSEGVPSRMGFESWFTDMARMFPRIRDTASKGNPCGSVGLGTKDAYIERAEQLGCLDPAGVVLLFPHVQLEGRENQSYLATRHMIATAESAEQMQAFIQSIQMITDSADRNLQDRCTKGQGIKCAKLGSKNIQDPKDDPLMELIPRMRVNLIAFDSTSLVKSIPLGARLAYFMRHTRSAGSDASSTKASITKQLQLEFGRETVVEQSTHLFDQWPVTTLGAL